MNNGILILFGKSNSKKRKLVYYYYIAKMSAL